MNIQQSLFSKGLVLVFTIATTGLFAQDAAPEAKPAAEKVKGTFENGVTINNQTVATPHKSALDFNIQHRFGAVKGKSDLYGLFAPSNIRLGLTYGILSNLSLGFGATKNKRLYDLNWKYTPIIQTTDNSVPVTLSYYGNAAVCALPKANFYANSDTRGIDSSNIFIDRMNFIHELMVAGKINDKISVQLALSYTHFNLVDSGFQHDIIGCSFVGRYRFSPQSSVLVEFDNPITKHSGAAKQKPNLGIGWEVSTGSHQFQMFLCSADAISYNQIMGYNQNQFDKAFKKKGFKEYNTFVLGFNITRELGF